MNDDAGSAWAAALIILVWLWCVVAFVPAFFAGKSNVVRRLVHTTGVVALALFVVFWVSLLAEDSDAAGYIVAPFTVAALVLWAMRRYLLASAAFAVSVGVLVVSGYGFLMFHGPVPLAVVSAVMGLFARERRAPA